MHAVTQGLTPVPFVVQRLLPMKALESVLSIRSNYHREKSTVFRFGFRVTLVHYEYEHTVRQRVAKRRRMRQECVGTPVHHHQAVRQR